MSCYLVEEFFDLFPQVLPEQKTVGANQEHAIVYLDKNKQVYFLLKKESCGWKLEFWVGSCAVNRLRLQSELAMKIDKDSRRLCPLHYYNDRGCASRLLILTKQDLLDDFGVLGDMVRLPYDQTGGYSGIVPNVGIAFPKLDEVLKLHLIVPDYQRGYCWETERVLNLLEDVANWQVSHPDPSESYRIGTAVVKHMEDERYCIVDGQQRLITFALYKSMTSCDCDLNGFELGENNRQSEALNALFKAKASIERWLKTHSNKIDLSRVSIGLVVIGEKTGDDLSFTFFNHINSSGKPLTDYDLLKSHHLRFVTGDALSHKMASFWNELEDKKCEVLHLLLYRLRHWLRNEGFSYCADESGDRDLFREFTLDYVPIGGLCTSRKDFAVGSVVSDGMEFFDYVRRYAIEYDRFKLLPIVGQFEKHLGWHSYGTLWSVIKALSFLFYCKFGETYLVSVMYGIAYRVSLVRNQGQVRRSCVSNSKELFSKLAQIIQCATHEGDVLGMLFDPKERYLRNQDKAAQVEYWKSLSCLRDSLIKSDDVLKRIVGDQQEKSL